jgi:hypothetical protein
MAETITDHPMLLYLTFVLPIVILVLLMIFQVDVLYIIAAVTWLGVSIMIFFLPIASDNGSSG